MLHFTWDKEEQERLSLLANGARAEVFYYTNKSMNYFVRRYETGDIALSYYAARKGHRTVALDESDFNFIQLTNGAFLYEF